jgi:hypothetical protein
VPAPEKSLRRIVHKVSVPTTAVLPPQMAPKAPPVMSPKEKNSTGQGAGEASRKSDSSSDGFCQLGVMTSGTPLLAEVLAALEADLRQYISSVATSDRTVVLGVATARGSEPPGVDPGTAADRWVSGAGMLVPRLSALPGHDRC